MRPSLEPVLPGRVVGIDEAGRGSVLGALVVGGFAVDGDRDRELRQLGVRDSKKLTPTRREEIRSGLTDVGTCWAVPLHPLEIDRWVSGGRLNQLEARTFAEIVRASRADRAYVDACDVNAPRFGRLVSRLSASRTQVISRHRADDEFLIVGAASIVAKVARDRSIRELEAQCGRTLGSGYPSDPTTIESVRWLLGEGAASMPEQIRQSWATTQRLKAERSARTLDSFP